MRKLLNLIIMFAGAASVSASTFVVPSDREMVHRADAIVIGSALDSYPQFTSDGGIETVTPFSVEQFIKGVELRQVINIYEPGGATRDLATVIAGVPRFEPGERVMLFLKRTGSERWSVAELVLGKFRFASDISGRKLLIRDEDEIVGWDPDLRPHQELRRSAERFTEFVREEASSGAAHPDYVVPADPLLVTPQLRPSSQSANRPSLVPVTTATYTATSYTMTISGTMGSRWNVFPNAVTFFAGASGEPGALGNGTTAVQLALSAWTNDAGSNVNYVYGGTDSTHTQGLHATDGANTVLFERDLSSWGISPFTCSANGYSGTLGIGGVTSASGTNVVNGETFVTTLEGDVEMNRGLANCTLLFSNGDFNTAVTHEIGHTLGFRHSDQNRNSNAACSTDPSLECSNLAVMKSFIPNGINGVLQPWDINAVRAVYPGSTLPPPPPPCVAPTILSSSQQQIVTQGFSVTLSVTAAGTAPLSYQWYTGLPGDRSFPIPGGTGASLNIPASGTRTHWARVFNSCGSANSAPVVVVVMLTPSGTSRRNDFNADRKSDILWRNFGTGENAIWLMDGFTVSSSSNIRSEDLTWKIVGTGDFDGDGKSDILWRNTSTGQNAIWLMDGFTLRSGSLITSENFVWAIVGIGDFDGDGKSDILWRKNVTGENAIWLMDGFTLRSGSYIHPEGDLNWMVVGVGDFNADGKADILWRNRSTGDNAIWLMSGFTLSQGSYIRSESLAWYIVGVGDYDGDRKSDILWRNFTTGDNAIWLMDSFTLRSGSYISGTQLLWKVVGAGDYDGDGKADILWRNTLTGQNAIWLMDAFTLRAGAYTQPKDLSWTVIP
jgi:hypothetical protein